MLAATRDRDHTILRRGFFLSVPGPKCSTHTSFDLYRQKRKKRNRHYKCKSQGALQDSVTGTFYQRIHDHNKYRSIIPRCLWKGCAGYGAGGRCRYRADVWLRDPPSQTHFSKFWHAQMCVSMCTDMCVDTCVDTHLVCCVPLEILSRGGAPRLLRPRSTHADIERWPI